MKKFLFTISTLFMGLSTQAQTVTTVAGSGSLGSANATGTLSSFNKPHGLTTDAAGNIYVADQINNMIRKITTAGVVTTFAGTGVAGSADGNASLATFRDPVGLCINSAGDLFVTDYTNQKIRKITSAGVVSTFAGSGLAGGVNGAGTTASFSGPVGICVDAADNLYVTEQVGHRIRKITPSGIVSTFAGSGFSGSANGTGTTATFNAPYGVCIDFNANLYIADQNNHKIRKITSAGVVTDFAGSGVQGALNGTGLAARFSLPLSVAIDYMGDIFVADYGNHMIRKITPSAVVSTYAGTGSPGYLNGSGSVARFRFPTGVCVNSIGDVFVADHENHVIRMIGTLSASIKNYSSSENLIQVYPNPATSNITIKSDDKIEIITAYDVLGKEVKTTTLSTLNIEELSTGMYYLQIKTAKGISTSRFIKE